MPPKEYNQFAREVWQADRRGYAGIQGRITDFGRGRGVKSILRVSKSSRKEVVVFNEYNEYKVPETIDGQ